MAKSKSHNVRNSSGRFCDFCEKLEEINPKVLGLVLLAAAVVWLLFVA